MAGNQRVAESHDATPIKELRLLLAFFGEGRTPEHHQVEPEEIPQPYRDLLVHDRHMTVTLERRHGQAVTVHPYQIHTIGDLYGRKLDLRTTDGGEVVMTGLMLFNFATCEPAVRARIEARQTPLGHILIEHNHLRRISTTSFVRIEPTDPLLERFGTVGNPAYGRLATIFVDEQPAVDLLEVVRP